MFRTQTLVYAAVLILCCFAMSWAGAGAIAILKPTPADDGVVGSLNPVLSVSIQHRSDKPMNVTFRSDASGQWRDIARLSGVKPGRLEVRARDMLYRGQTYHWSVTADDGEVSQTKTFSFNLATFVGSKRTVIMPSDCYKFGYVKRGCEKGKWFVTVQRGAWAAYDLDRGWYRTYQRLVRRECWKGGPAFGDSGDLGHTFWGYWNEKYHVLGNYRHGGNGFESVSSPSFEAFAKLDYDKDVKHTGLRTKCIHSQEGTSYTFGQDRAWIMAIDDDEPDKPAPNKRGLVKYWEWTKTDGWKKPVVIGAVSNNTGRVALVRHTRQTWYVFVTEGRVGVLDGLNNADFDSTLKYFKSTDAGETWGPLTDTRLPAHAIFSSVSFARYGDNYYVFLSENMDSFAWFTRDLENWNWNISHRGSPDKMMIARGSWMKPHGTLLHPSALICTVAAELGYHDDQYGIVVPVPRLVAGCEKPTLASPGNGSQLGKGTTETTLSVKVRGEQTYDVAFYWEDGTFIGEDKLLRNDDIAQVTATGLKPGTTYGWYAVARGALLEYYGSEPDTTSDEQRSDIMRFSVAK